jgi:hypothetical protein
MQIFKSSLLIAGHFGHKLIQKSVAEVIQKHDKNRAPLDTDTSSLKEYAKKSELGGFTACLTTRSESCCLCKAE